MNQEAELFQSLLQSTRRYIEQLGVKEFQPVNTSITVFEETDLATEGAKTEVLSTGIRLEDITAFIQVSGAFEGGFLFTAEDKLAKALAHRFLLEDISDEEAAKVAVEVVAEIANVISGNALTDREDRDIFLGNPLMIVTRKAEIRAKSSQLYIQACNTASGCLQCIYIPMEQRAELASILAVVLDKSMEEE